MTILALIAPMVAICVWLSWRLVSALRAGRQLAGVRLVTCPESGIAAAVSFDRRHAMLTAFAHHEADARLSHCSRWAVRGPCDQPCVPQAKAPDTAVANIVARWSARRRCVLCGTPLVEAPRLGHHIALRSSDGVTCEWPDVPPETLPEALPIRQAVCWNCHIAETFRRKHPELVTDCSNA